jgi:ribosomal protein S18 acetylase RimI-like enzyme
MSAPFRWATPSDARDLALILREMAVHYHQQPLADEATLAAAQRWLADESPAYPHFALAYREGVVAGLASVAIAHPGIDLQRLLFLKDLFVRTEFRSAGLGLGLLRFLAGHCIAQGIGRIDLTTEDWNEGALRFYDRLGAERHGQKLFLRLTLDTLADLAEGIARS